LVKEINTANGFKLNDGQYLISVSTKNFCDSVSGKLRSGDIVTVFIPPVATQNAVTTNSTSALTADNPPELQYVKVVAVTTASGQDTDKISSSSAPANNNQPATVTLLVNVKQAAILAGTEQNTVHFALAYRGGGAKAEELLKRQSTYFDNNSSTTSSADQTKTSSSAQASSPAQSSSSENSNTVEVTK
jgi:pilus assembly protein CpaB